MDNLFENKLKTVIVESSRKKITADDIDSDTDILKDLGMDSVRILEMVLAIERTFQIEFEDEYIGLESIETFDGLAAYVNEKITAK